MPYIKVGQENSGDIEVYYEDHGSGAQDRILPIQFSGERLPALIRDLTFAVIEGGPHAIAWTHADQVNAALADFIK